MKRNIIIILLLICQFSKAQSPLRYAGKAYSIYPYRTQLVGFPYTFLTGQYLTNKLYSLTVPYCPQKLNDGDYAVLFEKIELTPFNSTAETLKTNALIDSHPAIIFSIKNGQIDGPITFYSNCFNSKTGKLEIVAKGQFLKGNREGNWVMINPAYKSTEKDSINFQFHENKFTGTIKWVSKGITLVSGQFKEGLKTGIWKTFFQSYKSKGYKIENYKDGLAHGDFFDSLINPNKYKETIVLKYYNGNILPHIWFYNNNRKKLEARIDILDSLAYEKPGWKDSSTMYATITEKVSLNLPFELYNRLYSPYRLYNDDFFEALKSMYFSITTFAQTNDSIKQYYSGDRIKLSSSVGILLEDPVNPNKREYHKFNIVDAKKGIYSVSADKAFCNYLHKIYQIKDFELIEIYSRTRKYHFKNKILKLDNWELQNQNIVYWKSLHPGANFVRFPRKISNGDTSYAVAINEIQFNEFDIEEEKEFYKTTGHHSVVLDTNGIVHIYHYRRNKIKKQTITEVMEFLSDTSIASLQNLAFKRDNFLLYPSNYEDNYSISDCILNAELKLPKIYLNATPFTGKVTIEKGKKSLYSINLLKRNNSFEMIIKVPDLPRKEILLQCMSGEISPYYLPFGLGSQLTSIYNSGLPMKVVMQNQNKFLSINYFNQKKYGNYYYSFPNSKIEGTNYGGVIYDPDYFHDAVFGNYKNGYKHGLFSIQNTDNNQQSFFNFNQDTLEGDFTILNFGNVYQKAQFKLGKLDGYLRQYNVYPKNVATEIKFRNGQLVDTVKNYFDNGILSVKIILDSTTNSNFFKYECIKRMNSEKDIEVNTKISLNITPQWTNYFDNRTINQSKNIFYGGFSKEPWNVSSFDLDNYALNGFHQYYYKSGILSQEGKYFAGSRIGEWKYYHENGRLYKTIEYSDKQITNPYDSTELISASLCKGFDLKGKLLYVGYIKNTDYKYICSSTAPITFEDLIYLHYYDSLGEDLILPKTPFKITERYINDSLFMKGFIKHGFKDSIWRYYNNDGSLNSIGSYIKGQKSGLWLEGDLNGSVFEDDICYNKGFVQTILTDNLKINESYYHNNKLIYQNKMYINKSGSSIYNNLRFTKQFKDKRNKRYIAYQRSNY